MFYFLSLDAFPVLRYSQIDFSVLWGLGYLFSGVHGGCLRDHREQPLTPWVLGASWDCLHSLPRTFIILCQIRFVLKPCSFGLPLSSHRNNGISTTSVVHVMLIFETFIQISVTKQMTMYGPSVIYFPHAHGTGGNTLVVRSVILKV